MSACYITVCFTWNAITPPSGEPVTAKPPIYQGETISVCLTVPALCKPEKHSKVMRLYNAIYLYIYYYIYTNHPCEVRPNSIPAPIRCGRVWWPFGTSVHAISAILQCTVDLGEYHWGDPVESFTGCWATHSPTPMRRLLQLWRVFGQPG